MLKCFNTNIYILLVTYNSITRGYFGIPINKNKNKEVLNMNRNNLGGVAGNTPVYYKENDVVECKTMEVIANKLARGEMSLEDIKVRTVNRNKEIVWTQPTDFIVNDDQVLYQVNLRGNRSFECDDNLNMITEGAMNPKNIIYLTKNSCLLGVNCNTGATGLEPDLSSTLYGMYLGDGAKTTERAALSFTKGDKVNYVQGILDSLNIKYNKTLTENNVVNFYFDRKHLVKPDLADKNQVAGLLAGLISSDGCVFASEGYKTTIYVKFANTNFEYARLFKYCCFELGISFTSRIDYTDDDNLKDMMVVTTRCNKDAVNTLLQLNIRNDQKTPINILGDEYFENKQTKTAFLDPKEFIKPLGIEGTTYNFVVDGNLIIGEDFIVVGDGS